MWDVSKWDGNSEPDLPFRKFASIGEELRIGPLDTHEITEHHPNLLFIAIGDDADLEQLGDDEMFVTGWMAGSGPHLTLGSWKVSAKTSEVARLKASALRQTQQWAEKEGLTVSPAGGWLES